jgi:hypothetical protein
MQSLGEPDTAGVDADQAAVGPDHGSHFLGKRSEERLGVG